MIQKFIFFFRNNNIILRNASKDDDTSNTNNNNNNNNDDNDNKTNINNINDDIIFYNVNLSPEYTPNERYIQLLYILTELIVVAQQEVEQIVIKCDAKFYEKFHNRQKITNRKSTTPNIENLLSRIDENLQNKKISFEDGFVYSSQTDGMYLNNLIRKIKKK